MGALSPECPGPTPGAHGCSLHQLVRYPLAFSTSFRSVPCTRLLLERLILLLYAAHWSSSVVSVSRLDSGRHTVPAACGHACMQSHCSRVQLCNPVDCSPPGSSVHGILHARTPEWVARPSSRASSQPRDQTYVSYTGRWVL